MLSPNSIPSLARQRDHSACRRTDSPLQVRKQRSHGHRLNQASIYADVPPPCMHGALHGDESFPSQAGMTVGAAIKPHLDSSLDLSGSTFVEAGLPNCTVSPPTAMEHGRILRHISVSRRMLSKVKDVKDGIAQKTRGSHISLRGADSDSSLMRRLSGKRRQAIEETSLIRNFEVSRDSTVDMDMSGSQRSFTDSSTTTDELAFPISTMPLGLTADSAACADRLPPPSSPSRSPSSEATPRPASRLPVSPQQFINEPRVLLPYVIVPHVELKISMDRASVDVGLARDIWVGIDATVRTKVVHFAPGSRLSRSSLQRLPLDAILVLSQDTLQPVNRIAHRSIVELCSRLDMIGDRLAILVMRECPIHDATPTYECAELLDLQPPGAATASFLERLGTVPATSGYLKMSGTSEPLHNVLDAMSGYGLRRDTAHSFVIAQQPELLIHALAHTCTWPIHSIKIGLPSKLLETTPTPSHHSWALEFRTETEVRSDLLDNMIHDLRYSCSIGSIPSLRICYKPMDRCRIVEVVGQRAIKDVKLGQRCSLFLKMHIPKIDRPQGAPEAEMGVDSLFTELESIVGTLQTPFLHIEARYRHAMLPTDNVVTLREICNVKRPKTDSRWSIIGPQTAEQSLVHQGLAELLVSYYPPSKALALIDQWALQDCQRIRSHLVDVLARDEQNTRCAVTAVHPPTDTEHAGGENPTVIVTDTSTKLALATSPLPLIPPRTISAPKTTTAITIAPAAPSSEHCPGEAQGDSARQLWHHIRRSSLSSAQLLDMSPEKQLQQLEASDQTLKTLRDQALSNKRSVGAETLRAWKWEERTTAAGRQGEAPWL